MIDFVGGIWDSSDATGARWEVVGCLGAMISFVAAAAKAAPVALQYDAAEV